MNRITTKQEATSCWKNPVAIPGSAFPATTFLNAVGLPFFGYAGMITYIAQPRNT